MSICDNVLAGLKLTRSLLRGRANEIAERAPRQAARQAAAPVSEPVFGRIADRAQTLDSRTG